MGRVRGGEGRVEILSEGGGSGVGRRFSGRILDSGRVRREVTGRQFLVEVWCAEGRAGGAG